MHHDEIRLLDRFIQKLCYRSQDERVADPVKPILAQAIRLGDFLVDWVCAYGFGNSLVERRVEESDAFDFGELCFAQADYLQRGEIVTFVRATLAGSRAGI